MKRLLVLAILAIGLSAQGFATGVKAGLNSSTLDISGAEAQNGFLAGLLFNVDAALLNVDAEVLYVDGGAESGTLSFLHLPVTARINVLPTVFLRGGVQYESVLIAEDDQGNDLSSGFNSGMSVIIGAGAALDLPAIPGLIVDLRYSIPLYDFIDAGVAKAKINHFQISAGIMF